MLFGHMRISSDHVPIANNLIFQASFGDLGGTVLFVLKRILKLAALHRNGRQVVAHPQVFLVFSLRGIVTLLTIGPAIHLLMQTSVVRGQRRDQFAQILRRWAMLIYDFLWVLFITAAIINCVRTTQYCMNIKITIKDANPSPVLIQKNELSQVEHRKKNSLYQQPQRDRNPPKKDKNPPPPAKMSRDEKSLRQTGLRSSGQEEGMRQAEKKMMEDLDKMSKNQASLDMIHNSNNILKKQAEILEQNQRTLHNMVKNSQEKPVPPRVDGQDLEAVLRQVVRQVDEIKKIRDEIVSASKQFTRNVQASKPGKQVSFQGVPNVAEMNSNLKNLAEVSKNQLEGLENLEAIKSLQNFNIEGYTQAINSLKKQIIQYQKQSEQIERQLKLRAAKLQKLEVTPNFDEQQLAPYENYLKKKADAIDLHSIKDRIYEKLGHFDYSKFEYDISQIMSEIKGEMNDFTIVCKQYRVQVPEMKIDPKDLKGLDLKLTSAIDQYKAERGIDFSSANADNRASTGELSESGVRRTRRPGQPIIKGRDNPKKTSQKIPQAIRELNTKPIDLTTQVKLQKTSDMVQKTILQNERQTNKKEVQRNMKKNKIVKEDEDFDKYLEYRKQEQLELLYKQKRERLQRQKRQLYEEIKEEPEIYLNLNLRNEVKKEQSIEKKRQPSKKKEQEKKREESFEEEKEKEVEYKELKPIYGSQGQAIKAIGTEVLREKLKSILGGQNMPKRINEPVYQQNIEQTQPMPKMENMAENFINLINNTLTQVNNQISQTIQQKYEQRSLSKQRPEIHRRSPPRITVPKLEEFRPPPVFNMQFQQPGPMIPNQQIVQRQDVKIVPKNYEHFEYKEELDYGDLQVSEASYEQDFEQ